MEEDSEWLRKTAIERAGNGEDPEAIWTSLGKSRTWFYKWLKRSRQGDGDWFRERPSAPKALANRTKSEVEEIVQFARGILYNQGLFYGAQAISWQLKDWNVVPLPSLRTINRILRRHDLTHKRTGRYLPKGVAYPAPAANRPNDVHQADFIGSRFLRGGTSQKRFYVLNCIGISTGRCAVQEITDGKSNTAAAIWQIWRRIGLPKYLQVDNEMTFHGSQNAPRSLGPLMRLCLPMGVEPVFIPAREPWRNGVVEKFQEFWDKSVWRKEEIPDFASLRKANRLFEKKHNGQWRYSKLGEKHPCKP
jgi:transposase InsO family protein